MKRIIILFGCFFISVLFVASLRFMSERALQSANCFFRRLPPHAVTPGNIMDMKRMGNYFAGIDDDYLFMGNFYIRNKLFKVDSKLKNSNVLAMVFPKNTKLLDGCFNVVDSASIFSFDGNQPALLWGSLSALRYTGIVKPPYFTQAVHISQNSYALRVVLNGRNQLVKFKTDSTAFKMSPNLLSKQIDGIFCTDGNLIKVPNSKRIIYVYYYRNQFLCIDNNLQLLYKGKTIDTNSIAKIRVSKIISKNQTTLSAPPLYVNKQSAASEEYLFIHSGLTADNEVKESLADFSTIDVYEISTGKYKLSFYLPDFNGKKLTDFRVCGKNLYALYDHYLYKYKLNF